MFVLLVLAACDNDPSNTADERALGADGTSIAIEAPVLHQLDVTPGQPIQAGDIPTNAMLIAQGCYTEADHSVCRDIGASFYWQDDQLCWNDNGACGDTPNPSYDNITLVWFE